MYIYTILDLIMCVGFCHPVVLNLKLGSSSTGESSSAGLTSTDGLSTSSHPIAELEGSEYTEEDEGREEAEEERTLMAEAASSFSSTERGGASVGGASVGGPSVGNSKAKDGFARPKAPLAKQ